ncbi:unnamed protein product [Orchesella dallaii]|uniref:Adenosine deaminase n=1 Tax=Orchesella dallaii TaxID=48710 RepID=A0ABP1S354_9HEXA
MALRSNAYLCQEMGTSPLKRYLHQGHRVTLGSDDPMQFSNNKDPLLEEYQTCHPVLRFSDAEMCEFARTSIVISCFTNELKGQWLSTNLQFHEFLNDPVKTNVSKDRIEFRISTLKEEWKGLTSAAPPDAVPSLNLICSHMRECGAPPETFAELQVNILLAIPTMGGLKGPMFETLRFALEWLLTIKMEDAATQTTFASSPQKRQTETASRLALLQPHVDPDQVPRLTASIMVWIFVMLLFGIYLYGEF